MSATDWLKAEPDTTNAWRIWETCLPEGIHMLSPESVAALKRAAEKGAAIAAKHLKRDI